MPTGYYYHALEQMGTFLKLFFFFFLVCRFPNVGRPLRQKSMIDLRDPWAEHFQQQHQQQQHLWHRQQQQQQQQQQLGANSNSSGGSGNKKRWGGEKQHHHHHQHRPPMLRSATEHDIRVANNGRRQHHRQQQQQQLSSHLNLEELPPLLRRQMVRRGRGERGISGFFPPNRPIISRTFTRISQDILWLRPFPI